MAARCCAAAHAPAPLVLAPCRRASELRSCRAASDVELVSRAGRSYHCCTVILRVLYSSLVGAAVVPLRAPRARVFSVCRSSKASDSLFWKVCARFRKCLDTYPALPGHPDRSIDADREAAFQRCTTGAEVVRRTPVFRATLPHPPTLGSDGEFKKLCPREGHRQPLTSLTATRCTRYSTRYHREDTERESIIFAAQKAPRSKAPHTFGVC